MAKRDHSPGKLAAVGLKRLPDGLYADGGNLYLLVRGKSRSWVFRYVGSDGKRRNMGLGGLESVSLAEAREEARRLRAKLKHPSEPSDPLVERRAERDRARLSQVKRITFKEAAEQFIASKGIEWRNAKHRKQWEATLKTYAYPVIGNLPVADIDEGLVLKVLEPIWRTKTETASRLRGRIEAVLDWATVRKYRQGENPARWRGHLDTQLPSPAKIKPVVHHPALDYREIGAFMTELRAREGIGARALEFAILTATRSGEVRGATWDEIDLTERVWTIPAARMKAGKEHRVPLSNAAIALLNSLPRLEGNDHVFPSERSGRPLSDMTLTAVLRRMGYGELTVHGFRSTFRVWTAEQTSFPREVCEQALAHRLPDKVEAAYQRSDLFNKRRKLMDAWARFCGAASRPLGNNIFTIGGSS